MGIYLLEASFRVGVCESFPVWRFSYHPVLEQKDSTLETLDHGKDRWPQSTIADFETKISWTTHTRAKYGRLKKATSPSHWCIESGFMPNFLR